MKKIFVLLILMLFFGGILKSLDTKDNGLIVVEAAVSEAKISQAYDGIPTTPTKINGSNYLEFGLTADNWSQYNGYLGIRDSKEFYGFAEIIRNQKACAQNAVLLADIIINDTVSESGATYNFTPIATPCVGDYYKNGYQGTFDGNGYSISGLYINHTADSKTALFAFTGVNSVIKNLIIKNSYITGQRAAALVNFLYGKIQNCRLESSVTILSTGPNVAGIASTVCYYDTNTRGMISQCSSFATSKSLIFGVDTVAVIANIAKYVWQVKECYFLNGKTYSNDVKVDVGFYYSDEKKMNENDIYAKGYNSTSDAHTCYPISHNRVNGVCDYDGIDAYTECVFCAKILSGSKTAVRAHATNDIEYYGIDTSVHVQRHVCCQEVILEEAHTYNNEVCSVCNFSAINYTGHSGVINGNSFSLTSDLVIPEGKTLTIESGKKLIISEGVTLTNNGTIINNGTIENNGGIYNNGTFTNNSSLTCGVNAVSHPNYNSDGYCATCENENWPQPAQLVDGYYQLNNIGNLMWFAKFVNAGNTSANAILNTDVSLNSGDLSSLTGESSSYKLWNPIGLIINSNGVDQALTYTGTFDGGGHTICGLYYYDEYSYAADAGLFAIVGKGGTVKNVTVKNSYFAASSYLGAIVGTLKGGLIENCHNVNTKIASAARAGGIVGHISSGTVKKCTNSGEVVFYKVNDELSFNFESLGGIAGNVSGTIENCTNTGYVHGDGASTVGGITGQIYNGTVKGSINKGTVSFAYSSNVGGIVGYQYYGTISGCLNFGEVTGKSVVGGIIGNPFGNGGKYYNNYTTTNKATSTGDRDGCTTITLTDLANGRVAYETGLGQKLGVDEMPYVGGPKVYRYYDSNLEYKYTNDSNFTCNHTGGSATCALGAICSGCSTEYTEKLEGDHQWKGSTDGSDTHCLVCNAKCGVDTPHSTNYNDYCSRCNGWLAPNLAEDGYYEIKSIGNLMWFAEQVNSGNNNINARLVQNVTDGVIWRKYEFVPIGYSTISETNVGFAGIFDGAGYVLNLEKGYTYYHSHTPIAIPEEDGTYGLFGTLLPGAVVKNLGIKNHVYDNKTTYNAYVGTIAGRVMNGATITNCYVVDSTISSANNGSAGVIAGVNYGTVENCFTYNVTFTGPEGRNGGIVGDYNGGRVINSYTTIQSIGSTNSSYSGSSENSLANLTTTEFRSGIVAYYLNNTNPEVAIGQSIGSSYPVFNGPKVYQHALGDYNFYENNTTTVTLRNSLTISSNTTLLVPTGISLVIPSGVTLTNNGTLINNGRISGDGSLTGDGKFSVTKLTSSNLPKISNITYDGLDHFTEIMSLFDENLNVMGVIFDLNGYVMETNFETIKNVGNYIVKFVNGDDVVEVSFKITPYEVNESAISLEYSQINYNGLNHTPNFIHDTFSFEDGIDYCLEYSNNLNVGTAEVKIIFIGNFDGEITKTFTINGVTLGDTASVKCENPIFTGLELDPVVVSSGDVVLRKDIDYTVVYTNNIYPGTATVVITGINNVSGEVSLEFTITRPSLTISILDQELPYNEDINVKVFDQTAYTASGLVLGHTVVLGEELVSGGTDETITLLEILDSNAVDVLEYYDVTIEKSGKYHMFYQTYRYDSNGYHWRECMYNCDEVTDYELCHGDGATCTSDAYCDDCGAVYESKTGIHIWVDGICSVCNLEASIIAWIDTDGNNQYNGEEVGYTNFRFFEAEDGSTIKLYQLCEISVTGLNSSDRHITVDLNGQTLTVTDFISVQGENYTITIIDSSPNKTGKFIAETSLRVATSTLILDNVYYEGEVTMLDGTLEIKGNTKLTTLDASGGTVKLSEGYDFTSINVISYSENYSTIVTVGDKTLVYNVETMMYECSDSHSWIAADCITPKTCSCCKKTEGEALGHTTSGPATCESDEYCSVCETVVNKATGHSEEVLAAVSPTCTETGLTSGVWCSNCHEIYIAQEVISALKHTQGEAVVESNVNPTCTSDGSYDLAVYCVTCDEELSRKTITVMAHGHEEKQTITSQKAASCKSDGYINYTYNCSICNSDLRSETVILYSKGHQAGFPEMSNEIKSTCSYEGGYDLHVYCTVCNETVSFERITLPKLPHISNISEATCTQAKTCTVCYTTIQGITEHDYEITYKAADCYSSGGNSYICRDCNTGYFDATEEPVGHKYNLDSATCTENKYCISCEVVFEYALGHTDVWPTCTTPHYCRVCNETLGEASGHSYNVDAATCIEDKYCYVCSEVFETALGHTPNIESATCTENQYCTTCDEVINYAPGHVFSADNATCEEDLYCIKCNVVIIEAFGHSPNYSSYNCEYDIVCLDCGTLLSATQGHNYTKLVLCEVSCVMDGLYSYSCEYCYTSYEEKVPKIDHTPIQEGGKEATCTEAGYEGAWLCEGCGTTLESRETIAKLDHTDLDNNGVCDVCSNDICSHNIVTLPAVSPTCDETGLTEGSHCSECSAVLVEQEVVEALGHSPVVDNAVAATCSETGLTEGKHCSVCNEVLVAQEEVAALGHTNAEAVKENEVAATCKAAGSYDSVVYCSVCDAEISRETVAVEKLAHTEVVDVAKAATCSETGLTEGSHCSECSTVLVEQEVVPALGHSEVVIEGTSATCIETGLTNGKKCTVCNTITLNQEEIAKTPHNYSSSYNYDETHHWYQCECGEIEGKEKHTGGTATLTEKAKCDECGASYGDLKETPPASNDDTLKGGCGGSIVASIFSLISLSFAVLFLRKKRI